MPVYLHKTTITTGQNSFQNHAELRAFADVVNSSSDFDFIKNKHSDLRNEGKLLLVSRNYVNSTCFDACKYFDTQEAATLYSEWFESSKAQVQQAYNNVGWIITGHACTTVTDQDFTQIQIDAANAA